ncbi:carbohydrate ABC transporter permease [Jiella avicenniae]|uniref:Sugar ABC transporter permease n=1 Tax=Jiella avicenniae TaxID=2907202 RepID=A0A9X1P5J0_9HYPH|nr:sugar ABC transporter permease [Jiella avicenniae]MCE7029688.1 sugar ABC transporter permease [Jiella avicenniae]
MSVGWLAVVMNLPTLLTLLCVLAYPIIFAAFLSLHTVGLRELRRGELPFVGLDNFWFLFSDPLFWTSMKNTMILSVFSVTAEIVLAIGIALLINRKGLWTSVVSRLLILLPFAVPPIANGLIWTFVYAYNGGFLNRVLISTGLIDLPINWLGNADTAIYAVAVPYIWRSLPFCVLLIHAALQGISKDYYEAASVDGATSWSQFWEITLPLLRPVIVVLLILRTASAVVVFDEVIALTAGGPGNSTWVAAWYSYRKSFQPPFDIGVGAASAYVLAILVGILAIVYIKLIYKPGV